MTDSRALAAELNLIATAVYGEAQIADRPGQLARLEKIAADLRRIAAKLGTETAA